MGLLNYLNMGFPPEKAKRLQENTYYSLRPFYQYLDKAVRALEDEKRVRKMEWEKSEVTPEGVWIELISLDDRDSDKKYKEFLEEGSQLFELNTIRNGKVSFHRGNKITVLGRDKENHRLLVQKVPGSDFIAIRPNTYTLKKQREAIQRLQDQPVRDYLPLLRLFESKRDNPWPKFESVPIEKWHVLKEKTRDGTDEQRRFVEQALGTPDFAILEGPPGSGKTTAILELLLQLLSQGKRVLLCASTHVAVDNVLERILKPEYAENVLAVRIDSGGYRGKKKCVEEVTLENRVSSYKEELRKKLAGQKEKTLSQKTLLQAVQSGNSETLEQIVLQSANLVCGTTIGILQHPDIKSGQVYNDLFDALIVDESSKTTFQEFLVPALYARKWILVGDIRQLSPYVESDELADNLDAYLPDEQAGEVCLDVFNAHNAQCVVISADEESVRNLYIEQAKGLNVPVLDLDRAKDPSWKDFYSTHIILGSERMLKKHESLLPLDAVTVRGETLKEVSRRSHAWNIKHNIDTKGWGGEIAWRMVRRHDLRNTEEKGSHYEEALNDLFPAFLDEKEFEKLQRNLESVAYVALPSLLEMMQKGVKGKGSVTRGSVIAEGFSKYELKCRRVCLSFQHRMHPKISDFPREHFYKGKALHNASYVYEGRTWSFEGYGSETWWTDVRKRRGEEKTVNRNEAEKVVEGIGRFAQWANKNPRSEEEGGIWTIAVLTFYRAQERVLRSHLRILCKQGRKTTYFNLGDHVEITLKTVDSFQGHEADLVFLSMVRPGTNVGFLDSPNRLNVALTRARYQLVIVGDRTSYLSRKNRSTELRSLAKAHEESKALTYK